MVPGSAVSSVARLPSTMVDGSVVSLVSPKDCMAYCKSDATLVVTDWGMAAGSAGGGVDALSS